MAELEALASQVQYLLDRQAIRDVVERWPRGADRHDVELIESIFWPDAQVNYTTAFSGSPKEFSAWANELHDRRTVLHQHHITNHWAEISGDTAHAETYVIAFLRNPDGLQSVYGNRYIDRLERRNGEWRIAVREMVPEMRFEVSSNFQIGNTPEFAQARWDRSDLSFVRPLPRRPDSEKVARLPERHPRR